MAELDELRQLFIVDDDVVKGRIEALVRKALKFCVLDRTGRVYFNQTELSSRDRAKVVLVARSLAARLDENIKRDVSLDELSESTGLPRGQLRARMSEIVQERFAESPRSGVFQVVEHKIEPYLDSLG